MKYRLDPALLQFAIGGGSVVLTLIYMSSR